MRTLSAFVVLFILALAGSPVTAQADIQSDLQADFQALSQKFVSLAEAIPADKYTWRPAEGVRSVSESLMHVAGANYFFPTVVGQAMPEGIDPRGFEKDYTTREDVLRVFKGSLESMDKMLALGDLQAEVTAFGQTMTKAGFFHTAISHNHEHLGQMIAYARSIGVVPPWSQ